jgi:hypothetical protein
VTPRTLLATGLVAGLLLGVSGAEAAPKTLDGKKVKTLSFTAVAPPQVNDATALQNDLDSVERVTCGPPLCAFMDFVYKPAKGVKATGLLFESSWAAPVGTDIDLYVASVDKRGDAFQVAACGASAGTHERIYVPASAFKAGKTYRMIAYFYRSVGETVTTKVTLNAPNSVPTTVPTEAEAAAPINCGL